MTEAGGAADDADVPAVRGTSPVWWDFRLSAVVDMVSDEIEAGNEKPRTGGGAGSLVEVWQFFFYAPARPALVGPVISTSTRIDATALAGLACRCRAVVWRCSMGSR